MPRDYKHRAQTRPVKRPLPAWLWLLTGILLGGFVVGLVWLDGQSTGPGAEWVGAIPDRVPQDTPEPVRRVETPAPPIPRFDFYNLLPEMEVVVPDAEPAPPPVVPDVEPEPAVATAGPEPVPPASAPPASPDSYLVQVGSFKRSADAESLKARLALLGLEANIVSARIGASDTRFRVRSGPFHGKAALEKARRRLAASGYDGLVIRTDAN